MAENILEKIIQKKNEKIVNLKKTISLESLDELISVNKTFISFKDKIKNNIKDKIRKLKLKKFNKMFDNHITVAKSNKPIKYLT